jgi:hypothetical protein
MKQIAIGTSGLRTSRVGLGTWAIGGCMWGGTDEAQSIATIRLAVERGVTLIDTAPVYGFGRSEEIVGTLDPALRSTASVRIGQYNPDDRRRIRPGRLNASVIEWKRGRLQQSPSSRTS